MFSAEPFQKQEMLQAILASFPYPPWHWAKAFSDAKPGSFLLKMVLGVYGRGTN